MGVYFDPRVGSSSGVGNFATAAGLFDQFLGTGAQIRQTQLAGAKQEQEQSKQLFGPTLDQAKATAGKLQNELEGSNIDLATRKGSIAAINAAPSNLWKPTTDMSPDEYQSWSDLHSKNGATDLGGAARAWNSAMLDLHGKLAKPQGGVATGFTSGPNGINAEGYVSPFPTIQPPQTQAPDTRAGDNPAPSSNFYTGSSSSTQASAPAPSAPAPSAPVPPPPTGQPQQVPNLTPDQMFNPILRQWHQYQLETASKEQEFAKGQRELSLGSDEVQKREDQFGEAARQLAKMLPDLEATVNGTRLGAKDPKGANEGNYETDIPVWGDSSGATLLRTLPNEIAKNWKQLQNPGSQPLKPGQEDVAADNLIPMPGQNKLGINLGAFGFGPSNASTTKAIQDKENQLVERVRNYENAASTHLPVLNLDPAIRAKIGPPPQKLIDNATAQGKDVSEFSKQQSPNAEGLRTIWPGEEKSVKPGEQVIWGPTQHKIWRH